MTEIAAGGRPLDSAKMVSEVTLRRLSAVGAQANTLPSPTCGIDPAVVDHLAGDIDDHREADVGDPAVALDVAGDDVRRDAHQGDREDQADDQDARVVASRAGDGQDVVEAHADVGDRDAPRRRRSSSWPPAGPNARRR